MTSVVAKGVSLPPFYLLETKVNVLWSASKRAGVFIEDRVAEPVKGARPHEDLVGDDGLHVSRTLGGGANGARRRSRRGGWMGGVEKRPHRCDQGTEDSERQLDRVNDCSSG
jgi:hypothetical protein